ncbi:glutamyl-tRNA reductase [Paenibacillus aurantius]|uniref:Glutamyl-tRNA reductase n=1 Tax=Paenibacillus aurantius TaxID=2918900 RepID=A0AA96LHS6_9BACL|nr:glutamyl-tRNA reductase [Paenibacillus aurantius]WNQ14182.1 glutamyl-tRNA reductase [Paenibacillus aurantius]
MHILAVGLNYRTAPVEIREKFAIPADRMTEALAELKGTKSIMECIIVGTCNRTELYVVVDRMQMCGNILLSFIEKWFGVSREQFSSHLYILEDNQAIQHLFRVASGLDSMIIGETQILGQVRDAFLLAQTEGATGTLFNNLFKQAVTMAKRAHSETSIGENPVSVSYAAVELGKRIFGDFHGKTVLILGAGKMGELTAKHLHSNGAAKVLVVNRTKEKAAELAAKFSGSAYGMDRLPEALVEADIVISSTGSADTVLTKRMVQAVLPKRKSRPLFMIDIAVPRDLDPAISELSNVFLYDIDDLDIIVQSNLQERRQEAVKIEAMITEEMDAYNQWFKTLGVSPVIQSLQLKSSHIHEEVMESLLKKLPELDEREIKVIRKLTKSMMNQMLRDPILRVKEMAGQRNGEEALEMFTKLFALEELVEEAKPEAKKTEAVKWEPESVKPGQALLSLQPKEVLAGP